jgi:Fis family transcriptional regulator
MKIPPSAQMRSEDFAATYDASHGAMQRRQTTTLRASVMAAVGDYLDQVDADMVSDLHALVLAEVEAPLLEMVMQKTRSNQSKAAQMLGLNRGTLRTKLKQYGLLD